MPVPFVLSTTGMKCAACHAQNLAGAATCAACGADLVTAARPSTERPQILRPPGPALRPPGAVVRHDDNTVARSRPAPPAPPPAASRPAPRPAAPPPAASPTPPRPAAPPPAASPTPPRPAAPPPAASPTPARPAAPPPAVPSPAASPTSPRPAAPRREQHASASFEPVDRAASNAAASISSTRRTPSEPIPPTDLTEDHPSAAAVKRPVTVKRNAVGARTTPKDAALPPLWRQLAADTLDFLLAVVPAALAYLALISASSSVKDVPTGGGPEVLVEVLAASPGSLVFALVIGVAVHGLHHVVAVAKWSTTVGGLLFGLRIVDRNTGAVLAPGRAVARGVLSGVGVVFACIGPLYGYWLDGFRRGLGDLAARSVVLPRDALPRDRG